MAPELGESALWKDPFLEKHPDDTQAMCHHGTRIYDVSLSTEEKNMSPQKTPRQIGLLKTNVGSSSEVNKETNLGEPSRKHTHTHKHHP